ncbi:hypothetical protein K474DRAFT_72480 [Panus rudis PR-1116 ss-1]|nr:hypothetical protein K474DRAFT_72480 [Panus rudis PR-1116 ss-1]
MRFELIAWIDCLSACRSRADGRFVLCMVSVKVAVNALLSDVCCVRTHCLRNWRSRSSAVCHGAVARPKGGRGKTRQTRMGNTNREAPEVSTSLYFSSVAHCPISSLLILEFSPPSATLHFSRRAPCISDAVSRLHVLGSRKDLTASRSSRAMR